jgi:putative chitinase
MTQVWPGRFPTIASAQPYARNPRALANKTYGGRMGNRPGTDDGYNYRGRGLIQITGRDGYRQVGRIAGLPLEENPELASSGEFLLEVAGAFWQWKGLNPKADVDSVVAVTRLINGGTNGLADRKEWLAKARRTFVEDLDEAESPEEVDGDALAFHAPAVPPPNAVQIEVVQRKLAGMNYWPGRVDGKWGGVLAGAIAGFKNDRNLPGENVIDSALLAELDKADAEGFKRPVAEERANAKPADLAPKVVAVRESLKSRLIALWTLIITSVTSFFGAVVDKFGDLQSDPLVRKIIGMIGSVPWYVWGAGLCGAVWFILQSQNKIGGSVTAAYNDGRLLSGEEPS